MVDTRYRKNAGAVFTFKYHLVWCPKYRKPVLGGAVAERLKKLLYEKAAEAALLACWLPARRATSVDSMITLRSDWSANDWT